MSMTSTDFAKRVLNTENEKDARRSVLKRIILLGITLAITLGLSTLVLGPLIPPAFLLYTQIAQFALIGYFVMEIISNIVDKIGRKEKVRRTFTLVYLVRNNC